MQRYAADICARGMFLRTGRQLPLGARVRFELVLQSGRCALGGVGRVAWLRAAEPALGRPAGAGVAFERLRRGDRAVIERMDLARSGPSRFEEPDERADDTNLPGPSGAQLAKLLFEDLGAARSESEPGVSVFLSADLSSELGDGGWRYGGRPGSAEVVADLAEQLEPGAELRDPDELRESDDLRESHEQPQGALVEHEVELSALRPSEAPVAHSTVRPAPMPIAAVALCAAAVPGTARGAHRAQPATTAPALRARIEALRTGESSARVAVPGARSLAPAESAAPAAAPARPVVRADSTGASTEPPVVAAESSALNPVAASGAPAGPAPARAARPVTAKQSRPARRSAAVDRHVSAASLEHAAVPVALARAAVELAAAPGPSASAASAQTTTVVPAARAPVAAATSEVASAPAAAPEPAAVVPHKRGATTWPLAIALSVVIALACAVTYLALSDQLPRVLAPLGLG